MTAIRLTPCVHLVMSLTVSLRLSSDFVLIPLFLPLTHQGCQGLALEIESEKPEASPHVMRTSFEVGELGFTLAQPPIDSFGGFPSMISLTEDMFVHLRQGILPVLD